MGKAALYIPDEAVRSLADKVKKAYGFASLREAVESSLLDKLAARKQKMQSFEKKAVKLQAETKSFLGKNYQPDDEAEAKAFFDDLNGDY